MKIDNITDLVGIIDKYYERISTSQYCEILKATLSVYVDEKPDKQRAISEIEKHYAYIKDFANNELPLFLDNYNEI
jgi:hypothetical protein